VTIEAHPSDLTCNLACTYCYQEGMRDAVENKSAPLDMEAMKAELEKQNHHFTMFGGEVLVTPIEELEELFAFGYERWKENGIQTNGTLITDAHLELFAKYKVHVGISVDGPPELNRSRWAGSEAATDRMSRRTIEAIERVLADDRLSMSLILVLHRANASQERLPVLMKWLRGMRKKGLVEIDLHMLEVDSEKAKRYELTDEENIEALRKMKALEGEGFSVTLFKDFRWALMRDKELTPNCIWNACDPMTTRAVHGVSADGSVVNCGRVNKDGKNWLKGDDQSNTRTRLLYETPQVYNGCKGCKFFYACAGNCPGGAVDGDWRNRSARCLVWYTMLEDAEAEVVAKGKQPISLDEDRRREYEQAMLDPVAGMDVEHGDSHGDSWQAHGDGHGDSSSRWIYSIQVPVGRPPQ
jgi:uncharacterized protein